MRVRVLLLLTIPIVTLYQCRDVPSFQATNEHDPFRPGYLPKAPEYFTVTLGRNEVLLNWKIDNTLVSYSGFKISRKYSEEDTFHHLTNIPKNAYKFVYELEDTDFNPKRLNYYYKIETFFLKGSDTLFSSPKLTSLERGVSLSALFQPFPFTDPPYLGCTLNGEMDMFDQITFAEVIGQDTTEIYSFIPDNSNTNIQIPLDVQIKPDAYFIRGRSSYYDTGYIPAAIKFNNWFPFQNVELTDSNGSVSLVYYSSTSDDHSNTYFDKYDVKLTGYNEENESIQEGLSLTKLESSFFLELPSLDSTMRYQVEVTAYNGDYQTEVFERKIKYSGEDTLEPLKTTITQRGDFFNMDVNMDQTEMVLSNTVSKPQIVNLSTWTTVGINKLGVQKGEFFSPPSISGDHLLISDGDGGLELWQYGGFSSAFIKKVYDPVYDEFNAVDFEIISKSELAIMYSSKKAVDGITQQDVLAILDTETDTHSILRSFNRNSRSHNRIKFDRNRNSIFVAAVDSLSTSPIELTEISVSDGSLIQTLTTETGFTSPLSISTNNYGAELLISSPNKTIKLSIDDLANGDLYTKNYFKVYGYVGSAQSNDVCLALNFGSMNIICSSDFSESNPYFNDHYSGKLIGITKWIDHEQWLLVFEDRMSLLSFKKYWSLY